MQDIRALANHWYRHIALKSQLFSQSVTRSLETGKSQKQILVLDGVRAIACLLVLIYHLDSLTLYVAPLSGDTIGNLLKAISLNGSSGVFLFFFLSGFLLFLPYTRSLLFDTTWPSVRRYYLRRIFRILPGYFFALFMMILLFHPDFFQAQHWHDVWLFLTFRMSFRLSQQVDGPFWTLAIEFQFYLLLPLIAWMFSLFVRRRSVHSRLFKLTICLILLDIWGLLTRYWGAHIADKETFIPLPVSLALKRYIYGDQGKFFEVFAVGMLLALFYTYTHNSPQGEVWNRRMQKFSPWLLIVGLISLLCLAVGHLFFDNVNGSTSSNPSNVFPFLNPYIPIFYPAWPQWQTLAHGIAYALCTCAVLYAPRWLQKPFEWSILRWIGFISFSLYMWHVPFLYLFLGIVSPSILAQGLGHKTVYLAGWCWVLFVIVPISLTLYHWIEKPGISLGELCIRLLSIIGKKPSVPTIKPTKPEEVNIEEIVNAPLPVPR